MIEGLATYIVLLSTAPTRCGAGTMVSTFSAYAIDAHAEVYAEIIAARLAFTGPTTVAEVVEAVSAGGFAELRKEARRAYEEDDVGVFAKYRQGYYEKPAKKKKAVAPAGVK
jgi:hypothetical protein